MGRWLRPMAFLPELSGSLHPHDRNDSQSTAFKDRSGRPVFYNGGEGTENLKMTMPIDLVLVRHGESEGNAARRFSTAGDNSVFTDEFCSRHSSRLRLTDQGREQARVAGSWLKKNIGERFDRYLVSGYLRAMETAALLELPEAVWTYKKNKNLFLRSCERPTIESAKSTGFLRWALVNIQ